MKRRFPLHVHISTLFVMLILLIGSVIGGLGYKISRDILNTTASDLNTRITRETVSEFTSLLAPAQMATQLLSFAAVTQAKSLDERLANLGFMREALDNSAALTSLYIGYANGDFFLLRRLGSDSERADFNATGNTAYVVQSIERSAGVSSGTFIYLDAALVPLRREERPDYPEAYDPRQRDWYKAALATSGPIKTAPYLFFTNRKVGTTIAQRASKGEAVVGSDIHLATLNESLAQKKVTPGMLLLLANARGEILAYESFDKVVHAPTGGDAQPILAKLTEIGLPILAQLAPLLSSGASQSTESMTLTVAGETWRAGIS